MSGTVVIAGAGHAAGQVVASLRQHEFDGRIVLIGEEPYLPYQRPPLSKKFLAGKMPADRLYLKPESFYEGVSIHLDTTIEAIDRDAGRVRTSGGRTFAYDTLVLALGSRVRRLPVEGTGLPGVHYLRGIADVERIRADLDKARRLAVIGAGYIGLEVAAVARQAGLDVAVLEAADRVMSRAVSPEVSDFYQIQHANRGVKLRLSTSAASIDGNRRARTVTTTAGESIPADVIVIGIGIVPNVELAAEAGLEIDDGIVVDDHCMTSDPRIYAVGDCTLHPSGVFARNLRLESVHNALEQAKTAAANICGRDATYCDVPWFWSDQYDLKLQIAGLSEGYDEVVIRGDPATCSFSCVYLENGRIIAVDAINAPRDFVQSKQLIRHRVAISAERLAEAGVQLKDLAG